MKAEHARKAAARGEVGSHDVACSVYLARHSAYIDGELTAGERSAHEAHEAGCPSCARYARVLRDGSSLLRELPELEASPDFHARLQHRLFHVQDEAVLESVRRPWGSWLAVAAVVGLLAVTPWLWESAMTEGDVVADSAAGDPAAVSPLDPAADPDVFAPSPELFQSPALPLALNSPRPVLTTGYYTPIVVAPPQYRPVAYQGYGE